MPTRKNLKSKKTRKSVKKSNKKMIVHQIFFNIGKGEIHEIPRFYQCHKNNKSKCKKQGIQYKLWSRSMVEDLLNKSENQKYKRVYYDFEQDIMRIDFADILFYIDLVGYMLI